jgi:hypothetical protein
MWPILTKRLCTMTRSSNCAAAAAAAVLLNPTSVKNITTASSCNSLGITNRSIKCSGCTELDEKHLNSRVKTVSGDSKYHHSRRGRRVLMNRELEREIKSYREGESVTLTRIERARA